MDWDAPTTASPIADIEAIKSRVKIRRPMEAEMKPNLHIESKDGSMMQTVVRTMDGEALRVTRIALLMDNKSGHWIAELDFPFPELDIHAEFDTADAWQKLKHARKWLDNVEAELRRIDSEVQFGIAKQSIAPEDEESRARAMSEVHRELMAIEGEGFGEIIHTKPE